MQTFQLSNYDLGQIQANILILGQMLIKNAESVAWSTIEGEAGRGWQS